MLYKNILSGLRTVLMAFPQWVSPVSRSPMSEASWWRTGSLEDRGWGSSGSTTHRVTFPRHLPASSRGVMPGQCSLSAQNVTICLRLSVWVNFWLLGILRPERTKRHSLQRGGDTAARTRGDTRPQMSLGPPASVTGVSWPLTAPTALPRSSRQTRQPRNSWWPS